MRELPLPAWPHTPAPMYQCQGALPSLSLFLDFIHVFLPSAALLNPHRIKTLTHQYQALSRYIRASVPPHCSNSPPFDSLPRSLPHNALPGSLPPHCSAYLPPNPLLRPASSCLTALPCFLPPPALPRYLSPHCSACLPPSSFSCRAPSCLTALLPHSLLPCSGAGGCAPCAGAGLATVTRAVLAGRSGGGNSGKGHAGRAPCAGAGAATWPCGRCALR